ncbi:MAG: hypothetical protein ABH843_00900, partial [Candidatus Omnitrophota bacterium]
MEEDGHKIMEAKRIYYIAVIILFAAVSFAQFFTLNAECPSMGWTIQHDEKLFLPDARAFYLKGEQRLEDYDPMVSSGFGILGPRIVQLGFKIFGFNNYGLRLPFTLFTALAMIFLILSLMKINPNSMGFLLSLWHIISYRYFMITHYAVAENILVLFMLAIIWFYINKPQTLLRNLNRIAIICASLLLIKQNFPLYCLILLGCIAVAEKLPLGKIIRLILYSVVSLVIFFILQAIALKALGIFDVYINGIARGLSIYGGSSTKYFSTQRYPVPPNIIEVMPRYFEQLRAWYGQGYVNTLKLFGYTELTAVDKIAGNMLFLLFSALLFWLSK